MHTSEIHLEVDTEVRGPGLGSLDRVLRLARILDHAYLLFTFTFPHFSLMKWPSDTQKFSEQVGTAIVLLEKDETFLCRRHRTHKH
jgi:hypothetical protein